MSINSVTVAVNLENYQRALVISGTFCNDVRKSFNGQGDKTVWKSAKLFYCLSCVSAASFTFEAHAGKKKVKEGKKIFTPVYDAAKPPIGYIDFCTRHRKACQPQWGRPETIKLTKKNWKMMHHVNRYSNKTVKAITDQKLYNTPEYWAFPINAGDCEDYVLQKKRHLEGLGFPAETLLITVVLDKLGAGHAVLTVRTDRGDFILDNTRNEIRVWNATGYKFIKRQSQYYSTNWVSLRPMGKLTEDKKITLGE